MAKETQPKNVEVGSAFDLLGKSLEIVKRNWMAFAVVNIFSILSALTALFSRYDDADSSKQFGPSGNPFVGISGLELGTVLGLGIVLVIALIVVNLFLYAMLVTLEVSSSAGKKPELSELANAAKKYWIRLILLALLSGLIIIVGLILLIIPGIIAFGRLVMAPYFMVDKDLGVMDSIKSSNAMAKAHTGKVWGAIGVMVLVVIASAVISEIPRIGPLLGTAFSIAFALVLVLRYQQLKNLKVVVTEK